MLSSTKVSYRCVSTISALTEGAAWFAGVEVVLISAIRKGTADLVVVAGKSLD